MPSRYAAVILAALGALILWCVQTERLYLYVHERSAWLIGVSAPILLLMGVIGLRRTGHLHVDRVGAILMACPLLVVLAVPARALGSQALELHQPTGQITRSQLPEIPLGWTAATLDLDLRRLGELSRRDPLLSGLDGQRATLLGFVHRTPSLPADRFLVGRFVVRCCTADAVPLSFPVRSADAPSLARDTWVEVVGTIGRADASGAGLPMLLAEQITMVQPPARPYLYP
jgi:uncharacterized repeat protein (TIGR03943 family)